MKDYQIEDYRKQRWDGFKDYFVKMVQHGDCDPAYPCLRYICDRYELNIEQRFWIAWLYGTNYCAPTTFYIYNEFPDFENVSIDRLERWWNANKQRTFFQTDRARVKNFNLFVKSFIYYRNVAKIGQKKLFALLAQYENPEENYRTAFEFCRKNFYYFGRFSMFNYLEAVKELTGTNLRPDSMMLEEAESSRNGLLYAIGAESTIPEKKTPLFYRNLTTFLNKLKAELTLENPEIEVTYWNLETVACAYKKLFWQTRYFGYYIDRQQEEIKLMEKNVPDGVDWSVLWDFRREFFNHQFLGERQQRWQGIRKERMKLFMETGKLTDFPFPSRRFTKRVEFKGEDIYGNN